LSSNEKNKAAAVFDVGNYIKENKSKIYMIDGRPYDD
jgi:hypothetical protein